MGLSHFSEKEMKQMYQKPCTDHLGNTFPSQKAMCKHYHITKDSFNKRIKNNWTLKDALTVPIKKRNKSCKDHLDNTFPNVTAMCKHYNITKDVFNSRTKKGWSLKDALTTPIKNKHKGSCRDHLGNEFPSKKAMCVHYNISYDIFKERIKNNTPIEEALGVIPFICFRTKNTRITNNLFIKEVKAIHNKMLYAVCIYNDIEILLTHDEIIEIYRSKTRNAP